MSSSVLTAISERRSIRAYESTPLTDAQIGALVNAALESPSANNRQPWHFSVVTNQALLSDMNAACAKRGQSVSPRFADPDYHVFYHAPCVVFISTQGDWAHGVDCGIAVENIALAAQGMGLGSVILGLPRMAFEEKPDVFEKALSFPEAYKFVIAIAVGVAAASKEAHEKNPSKVSYIR